MPRLVGYIEWAVLDQDRQLIGTVDAIVTQDDRIPASSHAEVTARVQFRIPAYKTIDVYPAALSWDDVLNAEAQP